MGKTIAEVYEQFRNENWNEMTSSQRLRALQELEIISAAQNHSTPRKVVAKELEGAQYGYFDGKQIVVNKHILEDGIMVKNVLDEETGETQQVTRIVQDANIQMMDTIFHEDYHSFQEQAINGEIPKETLEAMGITEQTLHNWQSNNTMMNYVNPEIDGCLYRIQGLEESAFQKGESRTQQVFQYLNAKYGEDPNYQAYMKNITEEGYAKNLNMAQMRYGDIDIANTLQGKMNERYYLEQVQYFNEYSQKDVEVVLNQSMHHSLQNNKTQASIDSGKDSGLGHSNYGGFGSIGLSSNASHGTGTFSGGYSGFGNGNFGVSSNGNANGNSAGSSSGTSGGNSTGISSGTSAGTGFSGGME